MTRDPCDWAGWTPLCAVHGVRERSDPRPQNMIDAPGEVVEVAWVDSTGRSDWHDPEEATELLDKLACRSAGYLVHEDELGIVLALGAGGMGQYLHAMAIPRQAILSVVRLAPQGDPA